MKNTDARAQRMRPMLSKHGGIRFDVAKPAKPERFDRNASLVAMAEPRMGDRRKRRYSAQSTIDRWKEELSQAKRSTNPIKAAKKRAKVLADLYRESPDDPRVQTVFDADPILVADGQTAMLVTQRMLEARLAIFDAVLILVGLPSLTRGARTRMSILLKAAFPRLSSDAQAEWMRSEVRLAEVKDFLDGRPKADVKVLSEQLDQQFKANDLWAAARTLTTAAHVHLNDGQDPRALSDLLQIKDGEG